MHAEPLFAPDMRRTIGRLGIFCAASIAVHVLTLVAYVPRGAAGASDQGPSTVLQATLTRPSSATLPEEGPDRPSPAPDIPAADQTPPARGGSAEGLDLPLPDKWFTARELDVRAEPLSHVTIDYPQELAGSGLTGRVQVVIFIDERGTVRKVEVARAIPEGVFDKAAVKAWSEVRFSPAQKGGVAVKSQKVLELAYSPF